MINKRRAMKTVGLVMLGALILPVRGFSQTATSRVDDQIRALERATAQLPRQIQQFQELLREVRRVQQLQQAQPVQPKIPSPPARLTTVLPAGFVQPMSGRIVTVGGCDSEPTKGCSVDILSLRDTTHLKWPLKETVIERLCATRGGKVTVTRLNGKGCLVRLRHEKGYESVYYSRTLAPRSQYGGDLRNDSWIYAGERIGWIWAMPGVALKLHFRMEQWGTRLFLTGMTVGVMVRDGSQMPGSYPVPTSSQLAPSQVLSPETYRLWLENQIRAWRLRN